MTPFTSYFSRWLYFISHKYYKNVSLSYLNEPDLIPYSWQQKSCSAFSHPPVSLTHIITYCLKYEFYINSKAIQDICIKNAKHYFGQQKFTVTELILIINKYTFILRTQLNFSVKIYFHYIVVDTCLNESYCGFILV